MIQNNFLFNFSASYLGGGYKRLYNYAKWFNQAGGARFIIHPNCRGLISEFANNHYIVVNLSPLGRMVNDCSYLINIRKEFGPPDFYYSYGIPLYSKVGNIDWFHLSNVLPLCLSGIPIGIVERIKLSWLGSRIKRGLNFADVISTESRFSMGLINRKYASKMVISDNGYDELIQLQNVSVAASIENLATVIGTYSYKALDDSYRVFEMLRENNDGLKLVIIGDSGNIPRKLLENKNVVVTGWLDKDDVLKYLKKSKYYISTTYIENASNAVAEGVYIAAESYISDIGPHRELLAGVSFKKMVIPKMARPMLNVKGESVLFENLKSWDSIIVGMLEIVMKKGEIKRVHDINYPLRLIHTIPAISKGSTGGPTYAVVSLCESMIAKKHDLSLASLDWTSQQSLNYPFLQMFSLGNGPRKLGRSPLLNGWIKSQTHARGVDVIHNHGMWQMNAIYPCRAARKEKINLVISPHGGLSRWAMRHGSFFKRVFWPLIQYPAYKRATCFHATSVAEYEDIRRLGFRQPVAIIPHGIDLPDLVVKNENNPRTLLFLARLHRVKGLEILLQSWRMVQDLFPDWQLKIAGADSEKNAYLNQLLLLSQKLGLKRVEFIGEQSGADKLSVYNSADLYVLPSYTENFAITVAEAMASGLPVIVSTGAPWDGLEKHKAGWWIDITVDSLSTCLNEALSCTRNDLNAMGARGRQWMESEFAWSNIGDRMIQTYQWLLDGTRPVPDWVRLQ